jgi:hypothetical protein
MCRQVRSWLLAIAVVLLLAPWATAAAPAGSSAPDDVAKAHIAVQRVNVPLMGLRDEAAMVLVGTALIGLAAAVRRAA